jgi:hypothetical protein
MISLLWRTDVHTCDQTPSARTDDWKETVLGKLSEVGEIARVHHCSAVLDGGDFWNNKIPIRTSHGLVSRVAQVHERYPCSTWVNVGNHDVPLGQIDNLPDSPLETLFAAGVFRRLYDEHELVLEQDGVKVRVVGVPYHGPRYDLERFKRIERRDEDWLLCVAHVLASPQGGEMFKNEDILGYDDLPTLMPNVDVFCFLPGTKVLDWNGRQMPIEEVRESLALMGRHGEPVIVMEVHPVREIEEEIVKFDVEGVPSELMPGVTKEHPFWVARDLHCVLPSRSTRRCHPDKTMTSHPCSTCTRSPAVTAQWLGAQDVVAGDFVAIPVPQLPEITGIPQPGLARLLGYYLSEGNLILNRMKEPVAGVAWTQNKDRQEFHDDVRKTVAESFGLVVHLHDGTNGTSQQSCVYGREIAEWFRSHGGQHAQHKEISDEVWRWCASDRFELLRGWLVGDGPARDPERYDRIKSEVMGATTSPRLASQMFLLALSLGLRPYYTVRPPRENVEVLGSLCARTEELHVISFYGDDAENLAARMGVNFPERSKTKIAGFFHDGMYFARVRGTTTERYRGPVYNMRTSTEEYVAGMLVTHNCFGHWHKNQGITKLKGGQSIVNVGSLTRGSLTQDNLDRQPGVVVMGFWPRSAGIPPSLEFIPIKVKPAAEVFDVDKRAQEELRASMIDSFVDSVKRELRGAERRPYQELLGEMEIPDRVRERTLAYIEGGGQQRG